MSRIEINSDGRQVVVDSGDGDVDALAKTALDLWQKTEGPMRQSAGFAAQLVERATQFDHDRQYPIRAEAHTKEGE